MTKQERYLYEEIVDRTQEIIKLKDEVRRLEGKFAEESLVPEWTPEKIKDLQDDAMFWEMKCKELVEIIAHR
jgi:uncharacterized coiled-coil DUF342 family protein